MIANYRSGECAVADSGVDEGEAGREAGKLPEFVLLEGNVDSSRPCDSSILS